MTTPMHPNLQTLLRGQAVAGGVSPWNPLLPLSTQFPLPEVLRAVLARPVSFYENLAKEAVASDAAPLTNVVFLLDRSGSMHSAREATIAGYNKQVDVVREGAAAVGETTFTSVQFNDRVTLGQVAAPVSSISKLTMETYNPDGGTALFDAFGDALEALLKTPRMDSPNTATLLTLFTDGQEMDSRRYSAAILSQLVERLQATGRWSFALIGPSNGVMSLADLLKVSRGNVKGYNPHSVQERAAVFDVMAAASTNYFSSRSLGATAVGNLYAGGKP